MTKKVSPSPAEAPVTLSESDIGSSRSVTRRTVLGALGTRYRDRGRGNLRVHDAGRRRFPKSKKAAKKSTKKPAPKKPATETDSD